MNGLKGEEEEEERKNLSRIYIIHVYVENVKKKLYEI